MYDKLFGKICLDRQLITPKQLDEAIEARTRLKRLGMDRRIGEILVGKGYLAPETAAEIIAQQRVGNVPPGESILGRLAIQNGLISEAQLDHALTLQRAYLQESGASPTLGYILVEAGHLTIQQLDALVAAQARLQTEARKVTGTDGAGSPFDLVADTEEASVAAALYLVALPGQSEQVMTGATLRAKIINGLIGIDAMVRRDTESRFTPAADRPEFATAVNERKRREITKLARRQATSTILTSPRHRRFAATVIVAVAVVGAFFLGSVAFGPGKHLPPDRRWSLDDGLPHLPRSAPTDFPELISTAPPHPDALPPAQVTAFLNALGLFAAPTLDGVTRWVSASERDQLALWGTVAETERIGLQPFEIPDGLIYGIPTEGGIRLAEGSVREWSTADVRRQVAVWNALVTQRETIGRTDRPSARRVEMLLRAAAHCSAAQWPIHARRQLLDAYRLIPEHPQVRAELGFLLPGENPLDPTAAAVLIPTDAPRLPLPEALPEPLPGLHRVPGLLGSSATAELPDVPWLEMVPMLHPRDWFDGHTVLPDIAAQRRRAGLTQYLGYWLPTEPLMRWWPTSRFPTRLVMRSEGVSAWTDLPQFRNEILTEASRVYGHVEKEFLPVWQQIAPEWSMVAPNLLSAVLIVVGPNEPMPAWAGGVDGPTPVLVQVTDLRSPDALQIPLTRGFVSAILRATYGPRMPAWLRSAFSAEVADRMAARLGMHEWRDIERTIDLERIASSERRQPVAVADIFSERTPSPLHRAYAHAIWRLLRDRPRLETGVALSDLYRAIFAGDAEGLVAVYDRAGRQIGRDVLRDYVGAMSREIAATWEINPTNVAMLTPGHLAVAMRRPERLFCAIVGRPDESAPPSSPHDALGQALLGNYSLRELVALLRISASVRVVLTGDASAKIPLIEVFNRGHKPEWASRIGQLEPSW